ncbi:MAG TPA: hypothetical protein VF388_10810, partial [Lacunisphaera sp.]
VSSRMRRSRRAKFGRRHDHTAWKVNNNPADPIQRIYCKYLIISFKWNFIILRSYIKNHRSAFPSVG